MTTPSDVRFPLIDDHRQLATLADFIRWAASRMDEHQVFLGHGTTCYWDEAAWLVLDALHLPLSLDAQHWHAKLTPGEITRVVELIRRRCLEQIPTAYLLQRAWFMGQPYFVDERVLIPRSPFAALIADRFAPWISDAAAPLNLLDVGTGSGCLAIALAQHFPQAQVIGSDISFDALQVASENVLAHQVEDRVALVQSDVLDALLDEIGRPLLFDLIISNPPYVDPDEADDLPAEYHHEPALGLYAEDHGLAIVERLLDQAAKHLNPTGRVFIEVGNSRRLIDTTWPNHRLQWLSLPTTDAAILTISRQELTDWRGNSRNEPL
ncbi:50S ribosomal protein L3 N(5)-glutamine methyltransferase [Halothiobacillus sp. DCM-1]|uniref:50S ribosomal protein L3 N(5)-glutamine methyltransferase n=1 Tax=Halothiobacillus sp. DCM-1 TaxID=3112558 RepID=UPI00324A0314